MSLAPDFDEQTRSLVQLGRPLAQGRTSRADSSTGPGGRRSRCTRTVVSFALHRCDASDPDTELRRLMLELINYELELVAPWGMGGHRIGEVPCDNAELRVVALATERSRLLIPTYVQANAQFACRPTTGDSKMVIAGVADSTDVFQLSHVGLQPLKKQRISGGLRVEVDAELADSLLLLTEDPLVVTHINRTVAASKRRVIELELQLAERLLSDFETAAARKLLSKPERIEAWETARQALRTSRDLAQAKDYSSAFQFARRANRELSQLQTDVWREMTRPFDSPLSHPAGASFYLAAASNLVARTPADRRDWSSRLASRRRLRKPGRDDRRRLAATPNRPGRCGYLHRPFATPSPQWTNESAHHGVGQNARRRPERRRVSTGLDQHGTDHGRAGTAGANFRLDPH